MDWSRPRIAVVGSGAVGAYYGGRLVQGGMDVHFLLRSDYAEVKKNGWKVRSCDGDFELPASRLAVYDDPRKMPKADLVLIALKTTANHQFGGLITPLMHENSVALTLQNGLGNEEQLAGLFGEQRVMGGIAFVCINRLEGGIIHHMDQGWIQIGEYSKEIGPQRGEALTAMFKSCKIACERLENLMKGRWEKLVWNVPFNGLGAALDLTTDRLIGTEEGLTVVRALMREVIAGAAGLGLRIDDSIVEKKIHYTRGMGAYRTSMQVDRQVGRAMEVEAILGAPLRAAEAAGVKLPWMEAVYGMAKVVNSR